ncbi:hypothetical protein [Asaia bogorensis]|uniref:hypothetical protein n=1 Tax=Asaia bogorensis TaxID=91915 RepID=UPI0030162A33
MENPANPGDFSTNGTRGVVLSGMSETTNSSDFPIGVSVSITQICGKPATEFEMLTYAWYALGAKMRAAEGGAERETTNSPAEIGEGCTGRKRAAVRAALCGFVIALILMRIWEIGGAWSVLGAVCLVAFVNML